LNREQVENCGFAYLFQCNDYVVNLDFDKRENGKIAKNRLSLKERENLNFSDFDKFEIIISKEKEVYFRI